MPTRRELLATAGAALAADTAHSADTAGKVYRIGVVSATIGGKPQRTNGHTWHFAQYLHPTINLDAIKKHLNPGSAKMFREHCRNPRENFDQLPFADTRITHYYSTDKQESANYCEAFPGVQPASSLEAMVKEVDAIWVGDASGRGEDHFDLVAPGLERGLPTFCDKPIGGTVTGTRKIIDLAKKHRAPLMSSSLFRHQFGMEYALRLRDTNEFGPIHFVLASMMGGYTPEGWYIYGHHPVWSIVTLLGAGVEAVSMFARQNSAHALLTYADRMPGEVWYGRPDCRTYNEIFVWFASRAYQFSPAMENDFWYGHHYEMFRMAHTFREMVRTRKEPVPHDEILAVTAVLHAGGKSLKEKGRQVALAEVL